MTKLAKKFLFSISLVLLAVIGISVAVNSRFVNRYYIHQKKILLEQIADKLLAGKEETEETVASLEETYDAVIAVADTSGDINEVNEELKSAFLEKGLGLAKYWLWDQDYERTLKEGRFMRIYRQERMNYSLAVEYVELGGRLAGIAIVIPDMEEMIALINVCTMVIFGGALIVIILLCGFLVRKITIPLAGMEKFAKEIAGQNYGKIEVHTGDELETVAESMNQMSAAIRENLRGLEEKNRQMESLLNNVSHDLKTPVALIKAYTAGIRDGMDDGTFLDTIIRQNERMEDIIEKLLYLSRLKSGGKESETVDVGSLMEEQLEGLAIELRNRGLAVKTSKEGCAVIQGDRGAIGCMIENLLTNAVKYASGTFVEVRLLEKNGSLVFSVSNETEQEFDDPEQLWEPFYVGEESRNKNMSGTGLGLSMVRSIAEKYGYGCTCLAGKGKIEFIITF
ncbi:sensor histidine kinase [Clostridium transplantifaecale]|uniref:sensor histidine kinase n=1 Tax=Clostridium transplantifaecale TaxID=2479838 RepID=UPI000F6392D0|nr:HAMP domain-containing sensor histidine kinase [Clostridium transplantifaecale]